MEAPTIVPECVDCLIRLAGDFVTLAGGRGEDLRTRAESLARTVIQEYIHAPEGSFVALWQDGAPHGFSASPDLIRGPRTRSSP